MSNTKKIIIAGGAATTLVLIALGLGIYFLFTAWFGLPIGYAGPDQPIAFPHTKHAGATEDGGLGLDCTFCHRNVEIGAAATIPAVQACMYCHAGIVGSTQTAQTEISKIRTAYENENPIDWARVHRLPDHVQFWHAPHIKAGFECSQCHGDVASMTKVKQVEPLKMDYCVDCHRANNAPADCTTCHY